MPSRCGGPPHVRRQDAHATFAQKHIESGAAVHRPRAGESFASSDGRREDATLPTARRLGQAVILEDLLAIRLVDCHGRKRDLLFDRLAFDDLQRLADSFRAGRGV
jgi:hypothetical protein